MKPLWRQRRANLEAAQAAALQRQNLVSTVGLGGAWRTPRGRDRPDGGAARRVATKSVGSQRGGHCNSAGCCMYVQMLASCRVGWGRGIACVCACGVDPTLRSKCLTMCTPTTSNNTRRRGGSGRLGRHSRVELAGRSGLGPSPSAGLALGPRTVLAGPRSPSAGVGRRRALLAAVATIPESLPLPPPVPAAAPSPSDSSPPPAPA